MLTTLLFALAFTLPPQNSDAIIGVTAVHLESGQRISIRGNERFPMGSVYKFPIGIEVLQQVDAGKLDLATPITIEPKDFSPGWSPIRDNANGKPVTMTIGTLLESMVKMSDNTACDTLLALVGGPRAVTAKDIRVDRSEKEMSADLRKDGGVARYATDPRDTSTPDAMVELLTKFFRKQEGLEPASHDLLMKHMTDSPTGPRKLRSVLPTGWSLAHKTGSMPGTSNDVGILTSPNGEHIVIAIFTKSATSKDEVVDADIANVAKKVIEALRNAGASPAGSRAPRPRRAAGDAGAP